MNVRTCCALQHGIGHGLRMRRAGLGPDPYSMRRSEAGSLTGPPPGPGAAPRSRSQSIVPTAPRHVSRRRVVSQASTTASTDDSIPGAPHSPGLLWLCTNTHQSAPWYNRTCVETACQHWMSDIGITHNQLALLVNISEDHGTNNALSLAAVW